MAFECKNKKCSSYLDYMEGRCQKLNYSEWNLCKKNKGNVQKQNNNPIVN